MWSFERHADRLDVAWDGGAIGTYLHEHTQLTRPAWVNLRTPGGRPITREFPATDPANNDHPLFHPGLWISYGHLDGYDFWRLASPVLHHQFLSDPAVSDDGSTLSFEVRNRYATASHGTFICNEDVSYTLTRDDVGLLLSVDIHYRNPDRDFYFGDQEESGFGIRLASPFRVDTGTGHIVNDQGDENGAGVWGKEARWVDFSAAFDDRRAGVLLMMHPDNPRPCWMHARDYGLVVANPFPRQPQERAEPFTQTWVRQGDVFPLRFGVLLYETEGESLDGEERHASYAAQ